MKIEGITHYIVAIGYDSDGYIYANDPNKSETPRKQIQNKFQSCMKQAFIFWPQKKTTSPLKLDGAIIDISKWQGDINFRDLKKEVSLVIARAGVGSDADSKFDEYAKAMIDNKIPFGVYCYSYAGTASKAKEEARNMVSRAKKYNPLFYVMDAEEAKITNAAIKAFAEELRAQGAEKIGCYVANHRYAKYGYANLQDKFDFTWIPKYSSTKPTYFCDMWQYTSTGKINGISGNVDMNKITGDGKSLKYLLNLE